MKTINLFVIAIVVVLSSGQNSSAQDGVKGGGDQCKNEINKHRIALQEWIIKDFAKDLDFSKANVKGWTYDDPSPAKSYKKSILSVLEEGKVIVTCYLDPSRIKDPDARKIAEDEGITYKYIRIGSPAMPTTCVNYEDGEGISHIDCNYDLVMNSNSLGEPNFKNTHHEYASIAGVEMRTNSYYSDFSVSDQIGEFETWKMVKVLGPKKTLSEAIEVYVPFGTSNIDFSYTAKVKNYGLSFISFFADSIDQFIEKVIKDRPIQIVKSIPVKDGSRIKLINRIDIPFISNSSISDEECVAEISILGRNNGRTEGSTFQVIGKSNGYICTIETPVYVINFK